MSNGDSDRGFVEQGSLLVPNRRELLWTGGLLLASTSMVGGMTMPGMAADEPKKGGTLRVGLEGGTASTPLIRQPITTPCRSSSRWSS